MRKLIIKNKLSEALDSSNLEIDVQHWSDGKIIIFAKKNNEGAGYIEITPLEEKNGAVYVQQIMVPEEFQRQKIGTKLYERAVLESAKKGYKYFCSDQVRTQESDAFWKKQLQKAEKDEFFKKRLTREKVLNDEYSLDGYRYCLNISDVVQVDLNESNKNILSFKVEDIPPSKLLPKGGYKVVIEQNGENAGDIEVEIVEDKIYVSTIWVKQRFRGQSLGTKLYEEAVKEAKKRGKKYFCSDTNRSFAAESFWSKQLKKGRVNVRHDDEGTIRYCLNLENVTQVDLREDL